MPIYYKDQVRLTRHELAEIQTRCDEINMDPGEIKTRVDYEFFLSYFEIDRSVRHYEKLIATAYGSEFLEELRRNSDRPTLTIVRGTTNDGKKR